MYVHACTSESLLCGLLLWMIDVSTVESMLTTLKATYENSGMYVCV